MGLKIIDVDFESVLDSFVITFKLLRLEGELEILLVALYVTLLFSEVVFAFGAKLLCCFSEALFTVLHSLDSDKYILLS